MKKQHFLISLSIILGSFFLFSLRPDASEQKQITDKLLVIIFLVVIPLIFSTSFKNKEKEQRSPTPQQKIKITYFLNVSPKEKIGGGYSKTLLADQVPDIGWKLVFDTLCSFKVEQVHQEIDEHESTFLYSVHATAESSEEHIWYKDIREKLLKEGWQKTI